MQQNLKNKELYYVCGKDFVLFSSRDGHTTDIRHVHELKSMQEEEDTRIIINALSSS